MKHVLCLPLSIFAISEEILPKTWSVASTTNHSFLEDDLFDADELERQYQQPLDIGVYVLNVDTTDIMDQDFERLLISIESLDNLVWSLKY